MIFTDRTITVRKGESRIDEPIVVYRGDYELEVRFTILNSRFKFMSGTNMIESEKASYGQLAILTPYGGNIFSDIVRCNDGSVTFVLTAEMLNQIEEVGLYSFQIRLMDYNKESRVSIPPIEFGIEVREPIASEDHDNSVNNAIVGYSITKVVDGLNEYVPDTFDDNDNYNKTEWETGDRITEGKLNKIEDALDTINKNELKDKNELNRRITSNFNILTSEIDNLLSFPPSIDNAETADIRLGANGVVYSSAGTAVREQFKNVNQLFITDDYDVVSGYVNGINGNITTDSNGVVTSFIDISGRNDNNIKLRCSLFSAYGVAWYDENKKYLGGISGNTAVDYGYENTTSPQNIEFLVPNNAYYLVCSMRSTLYSHKSDFNINIAKIKSIVDNEKLKAISFKSINLIDPSKLTDGFLVRYGSGTLQAYVDWCVTDYIPISGDTKYYYSSKGPLGQMAFYDENMNYISGIPNSGVSTSLNVVTPQNAKFIRISIRIEHKHITQLVENTSYHPFKPYKEQLSIELIPDPKIIYVTPDDDLIDILKTHQGCKIIVKEGVYDIVNIYKNHYGEGYFEEYQGYLDSTEYVGNIPIDAGLPVSNGTELISNNGAKFIFNYSGDNENVKLYFSCFATGDGCILNGINCTAENVRYVVHDDYSGSVPFHSIFKNNIFKCDCAQCIGGGMGIYGVYEFENNVFEGGYKENVSYHNAGSSQACNNLIFNNNYFETRLSLRHYGSSNKMSSVIVSNNSFGSNIELRFENADSQIANIDLKQWNNQLR